MPKQIAIVPAKSHSSRVPNKNFREFSAGLSLVDLKLSQLKASEAFDEIWLSTDHEEGKDIAEKYGCSFVDREPRFTSDATPWHESLIGIIESTGVTDEESGISWCPPTSPFFSNFELVLNAFREDEGQSDSIFTTTPFSHFLLNPRGLPLNFQFGFWAQYSQLNDTYRVMNCAMWHAPLKVMKQYRYQIGVSPILFDTSILEGWDIDTEEEFELAQMLFKERGR